MESAMEGTNIRTTTIYPAAINTELLGTISDKGTAESDAEHVRPVRDLAGPDRQRRGVRDRPARGHDDQRVHGRPGQPALVRTGTAVRPHPSRQSPVNEYDIEPQTNMNNYPNFNDKVALVTGASSGMGLATAQAFAEAGASVTLADVKEEAVQEAAEKLVNEGHRALAIPCDVSNDAQVEAMVERTVAEFGRLDAAFNNAGVMSKNALTADSTMEEFDRVIGVNLRGVWSCMKHELRQMDRQGSGAIVNCSSIGGFRGNRVFRPIPRRSTGSSA